MYRYGIRPLTFFVPLNAVGVEFLGPKTGISLVFIIIGQHMGCLVKAGIMENKKGLWSDTIFVHTEQLETENQ